MDNVPYVCLYVDYLEAFEPFSLEERGRIVTAMLQYAVEGKTPDFTGSERYIWPMIKQKMDRDTAAYRARCERNRRNGSKGGRPGKNPVGLSETDGFSEEPKKANQNENQNENQNQNQNENQKESTDSEAGKPPVSVRKAYGSFGWVRLTDDQYSRLLSDLGEAETRRCIDYVDESAQATGNKNKWKDWNLVVRKCSRERWGKRSDNPSKTPTKQTDTIAQLARLYEMEGLTE